MKSSVENTGGLQRKLKIEIPASQVQGALDRAYTALQKQANLKGFRKGKAPISLIKTTYADRVHGDVAQELVGDAYSKALKEHELTPISYPHVHANPLVEGSDFHFEATLEIRPEVNLKKIEGLKVQREKLTIDEAKVSDVLQRIQESQAEHVVVLEDRPAQMGDFVEIDFKGFVDGQPLEGGQAEDFLLELGSKSFIEGFEDGLMGMRIGGSTELNLKFPDDYGHQELAGKPVRFEVQMKAVKKKVLPALNDELVKGMDGYDTFDALKETIIKDLEADETKRISEDFKGRLLKVLVAENPVEVPSQLHEEQKQALVQDVEKRLQQQGASAADIEEYKEKWGKDLDDTASFMIQSSFLVDALAKKWNIEASYSEINDKLQEYSQQTGLDLGKLKEFYGEGSRMGQLEHQITEAKVVEKLTELSNIDEVPADKLK